MQLVWLDLETTGLDPRSDRILEVACAFTTLEDPFEWRKAYFSTLTAPPRATLSPFILDMHTNNGLLDDCDERPIPIDIVEDDLLDLVLDEKEKAILAGNSVHFDLGFIRYHMPRLAKRLSHRVYDVSAVKLFCRSLGMPDTRMLNAPHRAWPDVQASIFEAQRCRDWLASQ